MEERERDTVLREEEEEERIREDGEVCDIGRERERARARERESEKERKREKKKKARERESRIPRMSVRRECMAWCFCAW